jgi:hypothetical protein
MQQALEVYERLLREDDSDPAELVISGTSAISACLMAKPKLKK